MPGKREADERTPQATAVRFEISGGESTKDTKGSGLGRLMGQYIDKALEWEDLRWIREASSVPIVLKGVQTVEDVRLAVEYGADGVVLSNHGGRSLGSYTITPPKRSRALTRSYFSTSTASESSRT